MIKLYESTDITVDGKDYEILDYVDYSDALAWYMSDCLSNDEKKQMALELVTDPDDITYLYTTNNKDIDWNWVDDIIGDSLDHHDVFDAYISANYDDIADKIRDIRAYEHDPYSYYGLSRYDFF